MRLPQLVPNAQTVPSVPHHSLCALKKRRDWGQLSRRSNARRFSTMNDSWLVADVNHSSHSEIETVRLSCKFCQIVGAHLAPLPIGCSELINPQHGIASAQCFEQHCCRRLLIQRFELYFISPLKKCCPIPCGFLASGICRKILSAPRTASPALRCSTHGSNIALLRLGLMNIAS